MKDSPYNKPVNSCNELKIGIIGVSLRGKMLAEGAVNAAPGVSIGAAADINADLLAEFSRKYGCFQTADYREMLDRPEIGAVIVASPDFLHEEHAVAALRAGKAVYLEKPIGITVESCDRILRCAMETGSKLYVGHNMRFFTVVRTMKELIDSGAIGEVKAAWCRHFVSYGGDAYFKDWHADRTKSNGLLLQKAAHDIDILHWFCGSQTRRLTAMGQLALYGNIAARRQADAPTPIVEFNEGNWPPEAQTELNPVMDVEDMSSVLLEMENGVQAAYQQCHFTPDAWRNYTVIGTRGRIENFGDTPGNAVVRVWNTRSDRYRAEGDLEVAPPEETGTHGGADPKIMKEFVRHVLFDEPISISPSEARQAVAAGVAATESLRNGSTPREIAPLSADLREYFSGHSQA